MSDPRVIITVMHLIQQVGVSCKWVTKSFERVAVSSEQLTKLFERMQIFLNGLQTVVNGILLEQKRKVVRVRFPMHGHIFHMF